MDSKNLIIIEKIKKLHSDMKTTGVGKKYPPIFKELVQELYQNGLSKKEISRSIPVSMFSIRKWTIDFDPSKKDNGEFSKVAIRQKQVMKFLIRHESGFSIELNDLDSLSLVLMKIKSL